jgi:hypothetical protein
VIHVIEGSRCLERLDYLDSLVYLDESAACPAASRAIGTRKGEHDT